jgi:hypothetical protein
MRPSIPTILALVILASGCTTTIRNQFNGEASNLKLDNQTETLQCEIPGYCSGPSANGGQFVGFGLPTDGFSFFVFYPKISSNQSTVINTAPPIVDAWLVRTNGYYDWSRILKTGDPEELHLAGGERLRGQITVRWKSNADFSLHVDLTGSDTDSTALRGEFKGYTQTRFDPVAPFQGLAMLFFGEGYSSATTNTIVINKQK